jgi:hypothetical protein
MAWLGIAATLGWNYAQHRRGKPTICSVTRGVLPRPVFLAAFSAGAGALAVHVWRGYVNA